MKQILLFISLAALIIANPAYALDSVDSKHGAGINVSAFLNTLKTENSVYNLAHKPEFFSDMAKAQNPQATVVACSDARVQTNMLSASPEGKFFMVRNIGNQLATAEGSVEYGIHHLHTPVLLFIGHSRCGAIAAVTGDYSKESSAIKHELDTISVNKDLDNMAGVFANVHNQVTAAMSKFADEIKEGKLAVIGAVLDFADDLHQGADKLIIINVNGETDKTKLENLEGLLPKPNAPAVKKRKKATP